MGVATATAAGQDHSLDPTLQPVVTSIVITAPFGQPPEIRITVASPYAGAKVTTENKIMGVAPTPVPGPERRPSATIGPPESIRPEPHPPAVRRPPIPVQAPKPEPPPSLSTAKGATQIETPYRRIFTPAP